MHSSTVSDKGYHFTVYIHHKCEWRSILIGKGDTKVNKIT